MTVSPLHRRCDLMLSKRRGDGSVREELGVRKSLCPLRVTRVEWGDQLADEVQQLVQIKGFAQIRNVMLLKKWRVDCHAGGVR